MLYSRKKISKAGEILMTTTSLKKREQAILLINEWRAHHLHPLNVLKNALIRTLEKNRIKPILVSQRLKRMTSIEFKLDLNPKMGLGGMQDIGGFRAVLKDEKVLLKLKEILIKNPFNHKLKNYKDYTLNPKPSGYRSIHFVYEYNSKNEKYNRLLLELQIRTKLQHIWATAVETAGLITQTSLKSSLGSDEFLTFFKYISSLFAIKENLPVLNEHKELSENQLMKVTCEYINNIKIIDLFKGITISAKKIETVSSKVGEYHIINIDLIKRVVKIRTFKKKDFEIASYEYLELEKKSNDHKNAVVLVSSDSIKSLKKAYPSYFLDTTQFIKILEKIIENCKKKDL